MQSYGHVKLGKSYKPRERERYMNDKQLAYFERRLLEWQKELVAESRETLDHLRNGQRDVGDSVDESVLLESQTLELRARDRHRKLLAKIDAALHRIRGGDYGYCEMTGEPIGLARLQARPIATLSVHAQELKEQRERNEQYHKVYLSVA